MLDGRSCAGHWAYRDLFRAAYPRSGSMPGAILDLTSEEDGLVTAGGVTSWQDLALHLIARLCGPEHAARTAKVYLLAGHEDGQLPFSAMTRPRPDGRRGHPRLPGVDRRELRDPEPGDAMAEHSGLTQPDLRPPVHRGDGPPADRLRPRPPHREARGCSSRRAAPRSTTWATRSGYEDPTFFRRLFKRTTGITPAAYRRKFARSSRRLAGGSKTSWRARRESRAWMSSTGRVSRPR